ncbi:MAG: radical SAM protein [Bacteroidales bacterium]|nr:radical SAM protein [Bacteroidales bacterium]
MQHFTIPVFIPELACPNRCVFCNQQKISGTLCMPGNEEVIEIIEKRLETIPAGNAVEIGFFGGNFTGIEPISQKNYLTIAKAYLDEGRICGIRVSTRPDYINNDALSLLKAYGVTTIELGAQSMDDNVLMYSGRGHTAEDVKKASALILENGFQLGLQMMLGLPGDTLEKAMNTAHQIIACGAGSTRIYPALVIKDTELEAHYHKGNYHPLSIEEAITWTKEIVKIFEQSSVKVLRIGLHPSEGLLSGKNLVAGPFHVAFGEMVSSALWKDEFEKELEVYPILSKANSYLKVEVPIGQVNAAIGHYALNKKMLLQHFKKVVFHENEELIGRQFLFTTEPLSEAAKH